jgi:hypothetical protein
VRGAGRLTNRRKDRALEWFLAGLSMVWGAHALVAADAVARHASRVPGLDGASWAALCLGLGVVHMIALLVNGTMSWTPLVRLLATAANAGFFAWVAALRVPLDMAGSALIYAYVTLGFLWCAYVAGQDVARMRLGTYGL